MKYAKWISLFFVCMLLTLGCGIWIGFYLDHYYYPNDSNEYSVKQLENHVQTDAAESDLYTGSDRNEQDPSKQLQLVDASVRDEVVSADTLYVLIERDMDSADEVVTNTRLPEKYLGMNREQFISSMEEYEANPPLSELERGFVSLEVNRFSASQVEVVMNYSYVKPSSSFYIVVYDGKVTVLLEDKKTIFLNTDINLFDLPNQMQQDIMQGMFVPDEESLYDFLEGYTS